MSRLLFGRGLKDENEDRFQQSCKFLLAQKKKKQVAGNMQKIEASPQGKHNSNNIFSTSSS